MNQSYSPQSFDNAPLDVNLARHLNVTLGGDSSTSNHYLYNALVLTVRDHLVQAWRHTRNNYHQDSRRQVHYLSLEFLMGRTLTNTVLNLDLEEEIRLALKHYGVTLEDMVNEERDAGLGNGGLGRLAACFLDSCATLELPVTGYGIRYEYGMFKQKIENGFQMELPDNWLRNGFPWEIECPENTRTIQFFGHTEIYSDGDQRQRHRWVNTHDVLAVPYDVPIPGYRNDTVNTLRLWQAKATDGFNLDEFNAGSYSESVAAKNAAEQITMVLYPNDVSENGKELRLKQQYFLASACLQDVIDRWLTAQRPNSEATQRNRFDGFAQENCFQLNDTHPTLAIPELMRLLIDVHDLEWDAAWEITTQTMAYTNHTLLPEALERWSVGLFRSLLPRLLEIVFEINARYMSEVAHRWPGDTDRQRRMSIIEEGHDPQVRMAYLAIVASFSVNGVAALHTTLLKDGLFKDFYEMWPHKFNNKTNGVTPRRWLAHCNPELSSLINQAIGDGWVANFEEISALEKCAEDKAFQSQWQHSKLVGKQHLAQLVRQECDIEFDTDMLFDVQVKRIHEYKRQLLNILHVVHLYDRIVRGDTHDMQPRCVLIGGKAAPGYVMAKQIIKLINNVAKVVNADSRAMPWLRVAFLPNYRVSSMEVICAGTELSEQISTAGKEASGTGNMKFMMNGAITIGTYDGANIEILEAVGEDNFFLFGLNAQEVEAKRLDYDPIAIIEADENLARVINLIESGHFSLFETNVFDSVIAALKHPGDPWMTAADFADFVTAQQQVGNAYRDQERWTRMSILNTSRSGHFSSDRTIRSYHTDIWS